MRRKIYYTYKYYPNNEKATEYSRRLGITKRLGILFALSIGWIAYLIAGEAFYYNDTTASHIGIAAGVVSAILELWFCISMKKKIDKCLEEQKAEEQRAAVQRMKQQMLEEQRRREQMLVEQEEYIEDEEEEYDTQKESPDGENSVAKYCSFCGHKVVFGDRYCSECGRTIRYD